MELRIPDKKNLLPLDFEYIDDTVDQYYRPIQGYFMRKRLDLALKFLVSPNKRKVKRILEVGYGGGTFLMALSQLGKEIYGIDVHSKMAVVRKILRKEGVSHARLSKASIFKTRFKDRFFDRVVCISVMEHFKGKELDMSCLEIKRILANGGYAVFGFPTKNIISNTIIEKVLKFEPDDIHPSGHKQILAAIKRNFDTFEIISYPSFLPLDLSLYVVVKAIKNTKGDRK